MIAEVDDVWNQVLAAREGRRALKVAARQVIPGRMAEQRALVGRAERLPALSTGTWVCG